mgnify:CR=1 FL=1
MLSFPLVMQARLEAADSIISRMHHAASQYMDFIHEYRAELYIKAQLDIIKKNRGFRFIPGLFRTPKDANRFIVETYSDLHYTAPNIYDQKIKAYIIIFRLYVKVIKNSRSSERGVCLETVRASK